jgi:hypothetical protein
VTGAARRGVVEAGRFPGCQQGRLVTGHVGESLGPTLEDPRHGETPDRKAELDRLVIAVAELQQELGACGTPIDKKLSMPRRLRW